MNIYNLGLTDWPLAQEIHNAPRWWKHGCASMFADGCAFFTDGTVIAKFSGIPYVGTELDGGWFKGMPKKPQSMSFFNRIEVRSARKVYRPSKGSLLGADKIRFSEDLAESCQGAGVAVPTGDVRIIADVSRTALRSDPPRNRYIAVSPDGRVGIETDGGTKLETKLKTKFGFKAEIDARACSMLEETQAEALELEVVGKRYLVARPVRKVRPPHAFSMEWAIIAIAWRGGQSTETTAKL